MIYKSASISLFCRAIWASLAILVFVLCGPVKKVIEMHLNRTSVSCYTHPADKKLKSGIPKYNEKRYITQLTECVSNQFTGGNALASSSSIQLNECTPYQLYCNQHLKIDSWSQLYLNFRKIRV
jgi:hypothetical protein